MIKVLICDGDGTLGFRQNHAAKIINSLNDLGITLAVSTNDHTQNIIQRFRHHGLTPPDVIVSKFDIASKGKADPKMVLEIASRLNVKPQEMAFLGDDDNTDIFCALNAGILPLSARYSTADKPRVYGIPIEDPSYLIRYLSNYSVQDNPYFGWFYSDRCTDTNTMIDMRALLGQHSDIPGFKELLKGMKPRNQITVGARKVELFRILANYLVTRIFLNGDVEPMEATIVTVYPGHKSGTENELLTQYANDFRHVFRSFARSLLIRHKDAPASKMQGDSRNIYDQFQTIHVNPDEKARIENKHIIVLDDYTTAGYSLETARRMLLQAGARKVTGIAMGKWRNIHTITEITKDWDAYKPCTLSKHDINCYDVNGTSEILADNNFKAILNKI